MMAYREMWFCEALAEVLDVSFFMVDETEGSDRSFDCGETDLDEAGIRHEVVHEECSLF